MRTTHSPETVAAPSSAYAHGVKVSNADTWLHISGQIGTDADGQLAGESEAQMEMCWERIMAVLEDADMTVEDIVKVTAYITDAADVALYREVRDRYLKGHLTASTLLVVSALAHPDWTVEIEAVAAK